MFFFPFFLLFFYFFYSPRANKLFSSKHHYSCGNENALSANVSYQVRRRGGGCRELINLCHFNCFSDSCPLVPHTAQRTHCRLVNYFVGEEIKKEKSTEKTLLRHRGWSHFISQTGSPPDITR